MSHSDDGDRSARGDCARKRRRERLRNLAFLSPWLIGIGVFFLYPLVSTVYFSFMKYDGFTPPTLDGLDNWTYVFHRLPVLLAGPAQHAVAGRRDGDPAGDLRARHRPADHQDQDRRRASSGRCSTCPTWRRRWRRRWRSRSCSTPGPARSTTSSASSGCPQPGWFNDPAWSKPALTLLALWGIGDLMVIFMAVAARRAAGAVRGGRARRRRAVAAVPLHHAAEHLADRAVRRGHRRHPDDAVLHAATRRGEGRQRRRSAARASSSSPATRTSRR